MFEPGTKWHYSIAVDITGVIIERLSGKTFSEYLSDNIFVPLGMKDTFFEVPNNKLNRFLPNHYYNKTTNSLGTINEDNTKISAGTNYEKVKFFSGGGGLLSTIDDYMKFCNLIQNNGSNVDLRFELDIKIRSNDSIEAIQVNAGGSSRIIFRII